MPTPTVPSPLSEHDVERQVNRILALLGQKPDSGVAMVTQTFRRQPEAVKDALVSRLAMHYASSNSEHYKRLEAENKKLKQPPHQLAVLEDLSHDGDNDRLAVVVTHEGLLEVPISEDVKDEQLIPGIRVALARNGAVIAVRGLPAACPAIEFARVLPDGRILADQGDQHFVLRPGGELIDEETTGELKSGDLIEYEASTRQAVRLAEPSTKAQEFVGEPPDVSWDDIGGLNDVRERIEEEVLGPIIFPEIYKAYGIHPATGILFEGPPGVGKTLLVKATGSALLSALDLKQDAPVLFRVKGTALQSSYVGEGPARIRAIAASAHKAAEEHGLAIIVLDDFEYGGGLHRGVGDRSSPAYSALSAALISEMDGVDRRDFRVVWAATVNRADLLDSALVRPGRFGQKIRVGRPGPEACVQILLVHLRGKPIAQRAAVEELADQVVQQLFSCDDDNLLMRVHYADSAFEEIFPRHVISGAVIAEAARGAALEAARRDRSNGATGPGGVRHEDLCKSLYAQLNSAISTVTASNAHLHYLGLPEDRRVVAVEHVWANRHVNGEIFVS